MGLATFAPGKSESAKTLEKRPSIKENAKQTSGELDHKWSQSCQEGVDCQIRFCINGHCTVLHGQMCASSAPGGGFPATDRGLGRAQLQRVGSSPMLTPFQQRTKTKRRAIFFSSLIRQPTQLIELRHLPT